jgi:hypothetical protein
MGSNVIKRARLHGASLHGTSLHTTRLRTRGYTLIASLLFLVLLSGIAIGLLMMVNTEGKVGGTDLQNNMAFHAAEGGIEMMYSNVAGVFQSAMSPTAAQICAVSSLQPTMVGVTWKDYSVSPSSGCTGTLTAIWGQISSGPNQGLWAQIIPVNMLATAALPGGQEVSMTRSAQVALIPVFQFGVFSESDLSFFSGPNFDMVGPVHTNGDLYPFVGPGSTLTFHNKVEAYGNVVRTQLANGWNANTNYNGTVYSPTAANGCSTTTTNCTALTAPNATSYGDGSVQGAGGDPPVSTYNTSAWNTFSKTTTDLLFINGNYGSATTVGTGAKNLKMPFVSGTTSPFQIIRRPPAGEATNSALSQSREYNLAQIHVLLSDGPAELPGGASDTNNVRLANITTAEATATSATATNAFGISISTGNYPSTLPAPGSGSYSLYFAAASNAFPDETPCAGTNCGTASSDTSLASDWTYAPTIPPLAAQTLTPASAPVLSGTSATGPLNVALCPPASVALANLPAGCPTTAPAYPYYAVGGTEVTSNSTALAATTASWNLIDGYVRVEYKDASGNWHPVTNEWLQLGFARGLVPPTASGGGTPAGGTANPINPNAILLLQEPADRNGNGAVDQVGIAPTCTTTRSRVCTAWTNALPPEVQPDTATTSPYFGLSTSATQSISMYNWYPINFYDAREGEVRDNTVSDNSCTTNGVMNAVEIDVGNLKRWLAGAIGTSGSNVDYIAQNGYVLYFSDRRGMLPNPNAPPPNLPYTKSGDSGLEDVINGSVAAGTPNGSLEPVPTGKTVSPEDVNENGVLDNFGTANLGLGFYGTVGSATKNLNAQINGVAPPDPFGTAANARIASCSTTARKNWVSGARHALRLVDGSLGNVPLSPVGTITDPGGFTVASENPVYVEGDYNSNSADTVWTTGADVLGHSSTAVIADAVTLLSSSWSDLSSLGLTGDGTVTNPGNRTANTDYYRVAIAGGKNINFPQPTWSGVAQDFGTDGGVHNFLRYLENWSGTLNYKGSIVSLFYATYATGIFKCCTTVYDPPTRNYSFDSDFTSPSGLPPGTPMFRDVESLGYRQMFTTRTY